MHSANFQTNTLSGISCGRNGDSVKLKNVNMSITAGVELSLKVKIQGGVYNLPIKVTGSGVNMGG